MQSFVASQKITGVEFLMNQMLGVLKYVVDKARSSANYNTPYTS